MTKEAMNKIGNTKRGGPKDIKYAGSLIITENYITIIVGLYTLYIQKTGK